jgi:tetratricopeptide (TPR) repeat protein
MGPGREAEISYFVGTAYAALGQQEQAKKAWGRAAAAAAAPPRMARRRGPGGLSPETAQLYYQALALEKLGQAEKAKSVFQGLSESARRAVQEMPPKPDPGASFEEQQRYRDRLATAHYIAGLAWLGLNEREKAGAEMVQALEVKPDHVGARTARAALER